ncbi:MAG: BON domain-containing protein [Acidobacteria bacterium]|nr:BON domain-containing protein [Acidobacteriota bacterium]
MTAAMRSLAAFLLAASLMLAQKQPTTDDALYDQVRLRLTKDPAVNGGALTVDVKQGMVTIRGKVRTERARQKAEKLAKKVKGVKSVDNQLSVDPNS